MGVDWLKEAHDQTDAGWYVLTKRYGHAYCGGCGQDNCHVGQECKDNSKGYCEYCPDRKELINERT